MFPCHLTAPWSHGPMALGSHGPMPMTESPHTPHFKVDGGSPNLFLPAWLRPPGWCWMLGVKLARFLLCGRGIHFPRSFLSNFEVGGEGGCTTASEANLRICQTGFSCLWAQKSRGRNYAEQNARGRFLMFPEGAGRLMTFRRPL